MSKPNAKSGGPSWYRQDQTREAAELLRGLFHDQAFELLGAAAAVRMFYRGRQWEVSVSAKGRSATGWGDTCQAAAWDAFAVWYVEHGRELAGLRFREGRLMVEGEGGR